jgi:hypothetical protein
MILPLTLKKGVVNIIGMSGQYDRNGWSACAGIYKILERGLDKQMALPVAPPLPGHDNIRGKDHYQ